MAFYQVPQGGGGFQQLHPENQGFTQLHDANNPAAQAYARMALARNGIHVPPGQDATAVWRQFSAQRASMRSQAAQAGPDPYEAGVSPNQPLGGAPAPSPAMPQIGPEQLGARLPDGGFHAPHMGPDIIDWKARIAQMAHALSPANTISRAANALGPFQHEQGGPAEQALAVRRIHAVNQAHTAARNIAGLMAHRKPSRSFRSVPRAY